MDLFANKGIKGFFIILAAILFLGLIFGQIIAYTNASYFRNQMIKHDYELAGYLSEAHPELASEIRAVFTSEKSKGHLEEGKALLEKSGYKNNTHLSLIPAVERLYKGNTVIASTFTIIMGAAILLAVYLFLKYQLKKIDRYSDDVRSIMNGKISTRLDDSEEGSLSKLAAAINVMTASLHAHIEREKQNRIFLKDTLMNVSHQLKTPLAALTMYTEIMKDESIDNEVIVSFLHKSGNELERMQTLIANLLKLAKLDAGIIELNKSEYIINNIINQAAKSLETRLEREQKTFEIRAGGEVAYTCDKEWMLEALSNLIKNAVDHTAAGDRIVAVIEETPLIVKISVEDNGEGIHPDDINHIFKRFYCSRFSQSKQGTGIGLTLAKSVVEMHDGFISVESAVREGTRFTVHLPKHTKQQD